MSLADDINAATLSFADGTARLRFSGDEIFFRGHFPDGPVLPVGDVRMPAPGEAVYDLPPGVRAARFACAVRADAPGPWTDCVASVHAETTGGDRVLLGEARVTASTSEISVAADLPDGVRAIVLRVDPGRYGAVQDSVVFAAPRLRVAD